MVDPTPIQKYIDLLQGKAVRDPGKVYGGLFPTSLIDVGKLSGPEIEGPLPLPKFDAAGGPYLELIIDALNLGKAAGGGFDRNDPESAKTITKSALDLFGGSQLVKAGQLPDPNTLGMHLGPLGTGATLGDAGTARARAEVEKLDPSGLTGILRLNQGPKNDRDVVVQPSWPTIKKRAQEAAQEELDDLNARMALNTDPSDLKRVAEEKNISARLNSRSIMAELPDDKAAFSTEAVKNIDRFIAYHDAAGEIAGTIAAGYHVPLTAGDRQSRVTTLGEMLNHPQLFEIYPKLKHLKVRFSKLESGVLGEFQPSSFSVDIDPSQIRSVRNSLGPDSKNMYATEQAEDVLGTLMHEVQHAVQDMDPVFKAKRSAAPQTPEQLDNWLLDLTGGANLETFSKLEKRLPDYVLKNKNAEWLKKVTEDPLFDKFNNYRTSSGEVGANITMRDLPLTLMERLSRSNPKEMLKSAGVSDRFKKGVSIDARDTPIGQLVSQIERAQKEELISSNTSPEKLDSVIGKIVDGIVDEFGVKGTEKFKKGGEVGIPKSVDNHFLAYINPQEAAMLQAMGGGVNPDGSQKMMNGVPSFNGDAGTSGASSAGDEASGAIDAKEAKEARGRDALDRGAEAALDKAARDKAQEEADIAAAIAAAQAKTWGGGFGFNFGIFGEVTEDPKDPKDEQNLKKGGEVKVPPNVRDHFLSYINPQEAAMLRAMGGGITAAGGQKMRNGVPIFEGGDNPGDDEGQGGAPASESSSGPSEAAAGDEASGAVDAEIAAQELMSGPEMDPSVSLSGIMGFTDSVLDRGFVSTALGKLGVSPQAATAAQTIVDLASTFSFMSNPVAAGLGLMGLGRDFTNINEDFDLNLDIDHDTDSDSDEGSFGQ